MLPALTYNSVYDSWFKLKNRDPFNYVNNKDFLFYAIIASHVFFLWFIATIFENYQDLIDRHGDLGQAITIINDIVIGLVGFLIIIWFFDGNSTQIYPLLGITFILYLVNVGLVIFNFDNNEIDGDYHKDPVRVANSFLLAYAFASYFIC